MPARGGDFERALGLGLALDLGQVGVAGKSRRRRHGEGCQHFAPGEVGADLQQVLRRQDFHAFDQRGFRRAFERQDEGARGVVPGGVPGVVPWSGFVADRGAHGERAAHRAQVAGEREFAGEFVGIQPGRLDLFRGDQDAERDRQVETAGFLGQVGRGEVHGDAPLRELEAAVLDRGAHAVAGFLDFGVGQADQGEGRQAGGEMDFDRDFRGRKARQRPRAENGERHRGRC
jgi:hypothetical protein